MKIIVTITGKTCSGKSNLESKLQSHFNLPKLVSHTTRPIRPNEVHGKDYFFVTEEEFDKVDLIEKVSFNNCQYGISLDQVLATGDNPCILVCEPNGLKQIAAYCSNNNFTHISVFVDVDARTQAERFVNRDLNSNLGQSYLVNRLDCMLGEEQSWRSAFRYSMICKFHQNNEEFILDTILSLVTSKPN